MLKQNSKATCKNSEKYLEKINVFKMQKCFFFLKMKEVDESLGREQRRERQKLISEMKEPITVNPTVINRMIKGFHEQVHDHTFIG